MGLAYWSISYYPTRNDCHWSVTSIFVQFSTKIQSKVGWCHKHVVILTFCEVSGIFKVVLGTSGNIKRFLDDPKIFTLNFIRIICIMETLKRFLKHLPFTWRHMEASDILKVILEASGKVCFLILNNFKLNKLF